jgi:hypothetical protein
LRTLIGVVDDTLGSAHCERHVQSAKHQLGGQCRGHRPADDPTAAGIEHDREIQKPRPRRNVGYVSYPQPIRRLRGEIALHQVRCLTGATFDCGDNELAPAHTGEAGLRHQPRDALAADTNALGGKLGMHPRHTIGTAGYLMGDTDFRQ